MQKFTTFTGIVAPLDRANVDTDAIIPKQFLKSIQRTGFGVNLFDEWRYLDMGEPGMDNSQRKINPAFILNQTPYQQASILLTRHNFGCGSSREHAPWALLDYGFKVIIAPGFADIFYNNCFKNGILPVVLESAIVDKLFDLVTQKTGYTLTINLQDKCILGENNDSIPFEIDEFRRHCLLAGLDEIGLSLEYSDEIKSYEQKQKLQTPWLFTDLMES